MDNIRKQDPTFTNFVAKTAAEAVDRYIRCRNNGLKPMLVPECLIACAVGLSGAELDKFESWIINPNENLDDVELVPDDTIRLYNEAIYQENCRRLEETPPLPADEDVWEVTGEITLDDEKLPDALAEAVREKLDLSPAVPCSMPST